jgi:hypothetical protein
LHCRESGRGEQHETKLGHDDGGPRKKPWQQKVLSAERFGAAISS